MVVEGDGVEGCLGTKANFLKGLEIAELEVKFCWNQKLISFTNFLSATYRHHHGIKPKTHAGHIIIRLLML